MCELTMAIGKTHTGVFAADVIKACGKRCWRSLIKEPNDEWRVIDASHYKVPPHAQVPEEAISAWIVPKEAQHQDTFGRGCAGYAAPDHCYRGYTPKPKTNASTCISPRASIARRCAVMTNICATSVT